MNSIIDIQNELLSKGKIIFEVKANPRSKSSEISKIESVNNLYLLKIKIKSIPEKGLANEEIISIISEKLKVPKSKIKILSGLTSSRKKISILL